MLKEELLSAPYGAPITQFGPSPHKRNAQDQAGLIATKTVSHISKTQVLYYHNKFEIYDLVSTICIFRFPLNFSTLLLMFLLLKLNSSQ
jgi:hypothetical protein